MSRTYNQPPGPAPSIDAMRDRRRRGATNATKERQCIAKQSYGYLRARRAARILRREHNEHVHAYPCPWGGHWHVGHSAYEDLAW